MPNRSGSTKSPFGIAQIFHCKIKINGMLRMCEMQPMRPREHKFAKEM